MTAAQRTEFWLIGSGHAWFLTQHNRSAVAQAAVTAFDRYIDECKAQGIATSTMPELATFVLLFRDAIKPYGIPAIIIWAVVSFLIQKLLEYLWDNYTQSLKGHEGAD